MKQLTMGSLFDGSGGFPLAGALEGIRPVWASEVEPYPIAVTRARFPHMKHYGDVSRINGADIEPVDIITFGSPCQDLSVAGKRAGLKHEAAGDEETTRSGLFLEAIRIIKEMREATHGVYPAYAIWENVTGAFSSSKGEDFRTVLNEFVNIVEPGAEVPPPPQGRWPYADVLMGDGWSVAYRTFDAQYWGVPQRRRRIYLVADFRGERAGKILFKRAGLRGHPAPRREAREGTAADIEDGSGTADKSAAFKITNSAKARTIGYEEEKSPTLSAESGGNMVPGCVIAYDARGNAESVRGVGINGDIANTLDASYYKGCEVRGFKEREVVVFDAYQHHGWRENTTTGPLTTANASNVRGDTPLVAVPYTLKIRQGVERDSAGKRAGKEPLLSENLSMTLGASQDQYLFQPHIVYGIGAYNSNAMKSSNPHSGIYEADTARTNDANGGNPACNQGGMVVLEGNGSRPSHRGDGWSESDVSYTLNTIERHAVAYGIDRAAFNQGENAQYKPQFDEELSAALIARGPNAVCYWDGGQTAGTLPASNANGAQRMPDKDNFNCVLEENEVEQRYIVRRLTPTECCRLQGFFDGWGETDAKEDLTDEEFEFWLDVRNTHGQINGKAVRHYTKAQMLTWYNKLHTDSAEYKMWGNGIALPCATYVMQGIVEAVKEDEE